MPGSKGMLRPDLNARRLHPGNGTHPPASIGITRNNNPRMPLTNLLNALAGAAVCGLLCWLLLSAAVRVAPLLRLRNAFRDLVLNMSAEQARAGLRRAEREALLLTAAPARLRVDSWRCGG